MKNLFCFTPALVYHVPQFLEKCGGLSIFNCQPVEKKNHQQSRMFHQGTQKGGRKSSYTKQVMENENRKIYARVKNLYRTKRTYREGGIQRMILELCTFTPTRIWRRARIVPLNCLSFSVYIK